MLNWGKISLEDFFNALPSQSALEMSLNILKSYIEGNCPKLLINGKINEKMTDSVLMSILFYGAYERLECLGKFSDVLGHTKMTSEPLIKILSSDDCNYILEILSDRQFLDHEKMTSLFLDQILLFLNPLIVLEFLVKFLDHERMTLNFLAQICLSKSPSNIFDLLGKYPDLLDPEKSELLDKIFLSKNPCEKIKTWKSYQEVNMTPECWLKVLSSSLSSEILSAIQGLSSSNFLGKKLTPELLEQVILLEHPYVSCDKLNKLVFDYQNLIRDNVNKEKQLTPELLSFFVSCDQSVLSMLNSEPELLNLSLSTLQQISSLKNSVTILEVITNLIRDVNKEKQLTPELLSFFISCDDLVLSMLNSEPKLLNLSLSTLQQISSLKNSYMILEAIKNLNLTAKQLATVKLKGSLDDDYLAITWD